MHPGSAGVGCNTAHAATHTCRGTGVDGLRGSVAGGVDHRGVRGVDFAVPFGLQGPVVAVLSDELLVVRLRGKVGAVCCRGRGHLCSLPREVRGNEELARTYPSGLGTGMYWKRGGGGRGSGTRRFVYQKWPE